MKRTAEFRASGLAVRDGSTFPKGEKWSPQLKSHVRFVAWVMLATVAIGHHSASADLLFYDDFEGDLSLWTGKYGGAHNGIITADPLDSENSVLMFADTNSYGDIFTVEAFDLVPGKSYTVSFDYLGLDNGLPGGTGGYAGLSADYPGEHLWYYGTASTSGAAPILADDNQWHRYSYEFISPLSMGDSVHLMFEDFRVGAGNVGGDAYFDNIIVHAPIPGAALLGLLGLGSSGGLFAWRKRRSASAA